LPHCYDTFSPLRLAPFEASQASFSLAHDSLVTAATLTATVDAGSIRAAIDSHFSEEVIAKAKAEPSSATVEDAGEGLATLIEANVESVARLMEVVHLQVELAFDSYAADILVGHAANVPKELADVRGAEVYIVAYTTEVAV
jgi:hypothetical protein